MLNAEEMSLGEIHYGVKQPNSRLKEGKKETRFGVPEEGGLTRNRRNVAVTF